MEYCHFLWKRNGKIREGRGKTKDFLKGERGVKGVKTLRREKETGTEVKAKEEKGWEELGRGERGRERQREDRYRCLGVVA